MKGRTGFMLGIAAGYVLGTKAGRERYDQIRSATSKFAEQEQVQTALEATAAPRSKMQQLFGKSLRYASTQLREGD